MLLRKAEAQQTASLEELGTLIALEAPPADPFGEVDSAIVAQANDGNIAGALAQLDSLDQQEDRVTQAW